MRTLSTGSGRSAVRGRGAGARRASGRRDARGPRLDAMVPVASCCEPPTSQRWRVFRALPIPRKSTSGPTMRFSRGKDPGYRRRARAAPRRRRDETADLLHAERGCQRGMALRRPQCPRRHRDDAGELHRPERWMPSRRPATGSSRSAAIHPATTVPMRNSAETLEAANIAVFATPEVMPGKYGKLLLNLRNVIEAALGVDADSIGSAGRCAPRRRRYWLRPASPGVTSAPETRGARS